MKIINNVKEMKHFLILWSGQAVSSLGSSMTSYALILWVYSQNGTTTSISMLSFFTYLPSILFCFITGTLADRWDKKRVMLLSDLLAALGTVSVFALYAGGSLQIWHLYLVNFIISLMNAFQLPASYVATSLLVPEGEYVRAGGLQALSASIVSIISPAAATVLLSLAGLEAVFVFDLASFSVAFLTLLIFIKLPELQKKAEEEKLPFLKSCMEGLRFLKEHRALLNMILFFSFINFIAYLTGFGIMPALILSRTGNDQTALGIVSTALGLGTMAGSILVTVLPTSKSRVKVVFLACALSFAITNTALAIGRSTWIWVLAAFAGYMPLPFLNANISTIMRFNVPLEMQGRVFSTRDTVQYCTIPLGLLLGGVLADNVFEPFMRTQSALQGLLAVLVGSDEGSGIAVMFLITGIVGCLSSLLCLKYKPFRELDGNSG